MVESAGCLTSFLRRTTRVFEKGSIQIYREIAQRVSEIFSSHLRSVAHLCLQRKKANARKFDVRLTSADSTDSTGGHAAYPHTRGRVHVHKRGRRGTVAFSTLAMQQWRLGSSDRARHNAPLTCLYSCREREAGRGIHGRPCNLVIDQFVTIWHFVCTGPVNRVYPGHDDRRVNEVCLGTSPCGRSLSHHAPFLLFLSFVSFFPPFIRRI